MPTVADIMDRDPVSVTPETTVEDVIKTLKRHELTGVPVVNDGGRCVGMITEADLVLTDEEDELHIPHYIDIMGGVVFLEPLRRWEEKFRKAVAATASAMMTEDPVTIEITASVHEAGRVISESGHNRVPVIDHGRLVGMVTRVDVLQALTSEG